MAGLSRAKNGAASLAYVPAIHDLFSWRRPGVTAPRRAQTRRLVARAASAI